MSCVVCVVCPFAGHGDGKLKYPRHSPNQETQIPEYIAVQIQIESLISFECSEAFEFLKFDRFQVQPVARKSQFK